jgi:1,4-alpha-glucan branching enzyme
MKRKIEKKAYSKNIEAKKTATKSKMVGTGSLKKQYMKSNPICRVTFRLPKEAAPSARTVHIVGDFNSWNITETPMKKLKNGDFTLTLGLPCNREYSFRYLINTERWENDWFADKYIPNPYGGDDSVVVI